MKIQYTVALIIIALCLVIYVILFETKPISDSSQKEAERITSFSKEDIKSLRLSYKTDELKLVRSGDNWKIDKPFKSDADKDKVNNNIERLMDWKSSRVITDKIKGSELKQFGFDNPELVIDFEWNKKIEPNQVLVGKTTPTDSGYYVLVKPSLKVYLSDTYIVEDLKKMIYDPPKPSPSPSK